MPITTLQVRPLMPLPVSASITIISLESCRVKDAISVVKSVVSVWRPAAPSVHTVSIKIQHLSAKPTERRFRLRVGAQLAPLSWRHQCLEQPTLQPTAYSRQIVATQQEGICGDAPRQHAIEETSVTFCLVDSVPITTPSGSGL